MNAVESMTSQFTNPPATFKRQLQGRRWASVLVVLGGWSVIVPASAQAPSTQAPSTQRISQPLTAARAEIQLVTTVVRLDIGKGSSGNLIEGTLDLGRDDRLDRTSSTRGDTQVVRLAARQVRRSLFNFNTLNHDPARWQVQLSPKVPLVLKIETGVGESVLDLEGLNVTNLSLKVGVGKATVHLPATGTVAASISGGVGQITVRIPKGMQARIQAQNGLGAVNVLGDFKHEGNIYTSSGYAGASNRVDLQIEGGVGQITVEQAGR